jgi:hypothetical protein
MDKKKASSTCEPAPKVTTAELTALLARRRRRAMPRNPFDLESDEEPDALDLPDDDDELSCLNSRTARSRRPKQPFGGASKENQPATGRRQGRGPKRKETSASGIARRTYGSRNSDKENQTEEEGIVVDGETGPVDAGGEVFGSEDSQVMLEMLGDELEKAAKKFKEVDRWELSFEEVTQSSSPRDAR